jgi:hypothetical protein
VNPRRRWLAAAVVPVLSATLLTVTAHPASAVEDTYQPSMTLAPTTWASIDRGADPQTTIDPAGDLPVGTTPTASTIHVARAFFRFDVTALRGTRIVGATLNAEETQANDCARRAIEVWAAWPVFEFDRWPGTENFRVATAGAPASGCLVADATFDVTRAITWALNNNQDTVTLSLRVPANREEDRRYGRRYASDSTISVRYNNPPPRPTEPMTNFSSCAGTAPGQTIRAGAVTFAATLPPDADGPDDEHVAQFEVWPVSDESRRVSVEVTPGWGDLATVDTSALSLPMEDHTTYAWRVRADDGTHSSPWAKTCHFTISSIAPNEPTVVSDIYPEGSTPAGDVGKTGRFTFTANDPDVVKFSWWAPGVPERLVKADQPGGSATVSLTPEGAGEYYIDVAAIDDGGNSSPRRRYTFTVLETRPYISANNYNESFPYGGIGVPDIFFFTATQPGATRFLYRLNDDPQVSVPVPSGRTTSIMITPTVGGINSLKVRTRDAAGNLGVWRTYMFQVRTAPEVDYADENNMNPVVGKPATVRMAPGMPGVVAYEYWWNDDSERQVVAADAQGKASFTFTPSADMWPFRLHVRSLTADGVYSAAWDYELSVDQAYANLTGPTIGNPGRPMTFRVSSPMVGITEYEWRVGEEWQVVPADEDGVGHITWTPTELGHVTLFARARNGDGVVSGAGSISVEINTSPGVSSAEYPEWQYGGGVGVQGTFLFSPGMDGVVEYEYLISESWSGTVVEGTVAAEADGTASVRYTPTATDNHYLQVRGRTADGTTSDWRIYSFSVNYE